MASISTDKSGNRRIIFTNGDGKRTPIYVGKLRMRDAETIANKIEAILSAMSSRRPMEPDLAEWVANVPDWLAEKLAAKGLIAARVKAELESTSISDFIDTYLAERVDLKASTVEQLRQVQNNLRKFTGEAMTLKEFTQGHADAFKASMASKMADNSVRRNLGRSRQFFEAAVRRRLLESNPFGHLKSLTVKGNAERFQFVTPEEIQRVIDAAPDAQWRLIIALARFGGLRTPSETLALKWSDVDWERQRIRVPSPKTERYGKSFREIPLFPELEPYLRDAFELAEEKTVFAVTRYRDVSQNLRTKMLKIINRAGLTPWERVFHNLRASRQTELAQTFPAHVVCAWMGNSEAVAGEHYLHTTDADFQRATAKTTRIPTRASTEMAETPRNVRPAGNPEMKKPRDFAGFRSGSSRCNRYELPDQDLNLDKQNQNLLCYRYTIGYRSWAESSG